MSDRFALLVQDKILQKRVIKIAGEFEAEVSVYASPEEMNPDEPPTAMIVEVELAGAIDLIAAAKKRWPDCLLTASVAFPKPELWHAAVAAGCHFVSNRGAFAQNFRKHLKSRSLGGGGEAVPGKRIPVSMNSRAEDGLAGTVPDAPDGELAVYRVDGELYAVRDVCPHAGTLMSDGCLEGGVITCPLHGSQFDVRTGERLRGPSDVPIRTYRVLREGDDVLVEV